MTTVVIGATGGVGSALCHKLAGKGHTLLIVGRDADKLQALSETLRTSYQADVSMLIADAGRTEEFSQNFAAACRKLPTIETLLAPIGLSQSNDDGTQSLPEMQSLLDVNFVSVMIATEAVISHMKQNDRGAIVAFSSIAVARPRGANVVYAAAKRALESYFGSLRHRLANTNLRFSVYRLGYVATAQNQNKSLLFPQARPEHVAQHVVKHIERRRTGTITYPYFWIPLTIVLRMLPWTIYKRLRY